MCLCSRLDTKDSKAMSKHAIEKELNELQIYIPW